jgi:hypothetical protein
MMLVETSAPLQNKGPNVAVEKVSVQQSFGAVFITFHEWLSAALASIHGSQAQPVAHF